MPATHTIKCERRFFQAVKRGDKTFEIRHDGDRGYQTGDTLEMIEIPDGGTASPPQQPVSGGAPEVIKREISYVLHGGKFGIQDGYVVLGLRDE